MLSYWTCKLQKKNSKKWTADKETLLLNLTGVNIIKNVQLLGSNFLCKNKCFKDKKKKERKCFYFRTRCQPPPMPSIKQLQSSGNPGCKVKLCSRFQKVLLLLQKIFEKYHMHFLLNHALFILWKDVLPQNISFFFFLNYDLKFWNQ